MICPNCHTNLQDNANVCHKCGAVINTDGLKRQQQMAEDSRNGMGSTRRLNIQNNTYKRPSEKKSENFSGSGKSVSTGVLTGVLISAIIILVVAIIRLNVTGFVTTFACLIKIRASRKKRKQH